MATIKTGPCPSCGKERELISFKFGVIQSTCCVYCLKRYLDNVIIPRLKKSSSDVDDVLIGENNDE